MDMPAMGDVTVLPDVLLPVILSQAIETRQKTAKVPKIIIQFFLLFFMSAS
jgi:hypothetical protein